MIYSRITERGEGKEGGLIVAWRRKGGLCVKEGRFEWLSTTGFEARLKFFSDIE